MRTYDLTAGKRPKDGEEFILTVEFHNGQRYSFYGQTKKACEAKFKDKFPSYKGVVKKEWEIL